MAMQTLWHLDCTIVFSTRNHLRFYTDQSEQEVWSCIKRVLDDSGASPVSIQRGANSPLSGAVQYKDSLLQIEISVHGTVGPVEIYEKIRKELWDRLRDSTPNIKSNPLPRHCLVLDRKEEDLIYQYAQSHTWRHKGE